jgi:hypothetical protein
LRECRISRSGCPGDRLKRVGSRLRIHEFRPSKSLEHKIRSFHVTFATVLVGGVETSLRVGRKKELDAFHVPSPFPWTGTCLVGQRLEPLKRPWLEEWYPRRSRLQFRNGPWFEHRAQRR